MNNDVVISARNVSKKFCKNLRRSMIYGIADLSKNLIGLKPDTTKLKKSEFWALDDISFELKRGESLGLIGVNGSGKTTLLRLLAGIFPPDRGEIIIRGKVGALIAVGAGFHPHMTGRENIYLNGTLLGMHRKEINSKFNDIVGFAGIDDFLDAPVSTYSSGMRVRLGFSIATAIEPDLLLVDEILAVGDVSFRSRCYERIGKILKNAAVIFVSHNREQVLRICDNGLYLRKNKNIETGPIKDILSRYESEEIHVTKEAEYINKYGDCYGFEVKPEKQKIEHGDDLPISIMLSLKQQPTEPLLRVVIFHPSIGAVADWTSRDMPGVIPINSGYNQLKFIIKNLRLRPGKYSVSVVLHDHGGKTMLAHAYRYFQFNIVGTKIVETSYAFEGVLLKEPN